MTEQERDELNQLNASGKLWTKKQFKRYFTVAMIIFASALLFIAVGIILGVIGGDSNTSLRIIGLVMTGIGVVVLFVLWGYADANREKQSLYLKSKRKFPEYFTE